MSWTRCFLSVDKTLIRVDLRIRMFTRRYKSRFFYLSILISTETHCITLTLSTKKNRSVFSFGHSFMVDHHVDYDFVAEKNYF